MTIRTPELEEKMTLLERRGRPRKVRPADVEEIQSPGDVEMLHDEAEAEPVLDPVELETVSVTPPVEQPTELPPLPPGWGFIPNCPPPSYEDAPKHELYVWPTAEDGSTVLNPAPMVPTITISSEDTDMVDQTPCPPTSDTPAPVWSHPYNTRSKSK